jgi:hypothetical protein
MNKQREDYRYALETAKDSDNNHYLKTHFFTICTQKTDYQIELMKRDMKNINRQVNQFFIHKRKYKKSPNRIVFYSFFEKSKDKKLTHCHFICRIPNFLKHKIEVLSSVLEKFVSKLKYSFRVRKEDYSIAYPTKHYSDHNDNFDVF